jgi:hypothetical protein
LCVIPQLVRKIDEEIGGSMRKRVVGATAVLAAGLALSGCAASNTGQPPANPAPQVGSVENGAAQTETSTQVTKSTGQAEDPGDNGLSTEDSPCTGRDLTAQYQSGEVSLTAGEGNLVVTKMRATPASWTATRTCGCSMGAASS